MSDRNIPNEERAPLPEDIRWFPEVEPRVETGPIAFGNDWPGIFIRGDNAAAYALHLRTVIEGPKEMQCFSKSVLLGLLSDLESSNLALRNNPALKDRSDG